MSDVENASESAQEGVMKRIRSFVERWRTPVSDTESAVRGISDAELETSGEAPSSEQESRGGGKEGGADVNVGGADVGNEMPAAQDEREQDASAEDDDAVRQDVTQALRQMLAPVNGRDIAVMSVCGAARAITESMKPSFLHSDDRVLAGSGILANVVFQQLAGMLVSASKMFDGDEPNSEMMNLAASYLDVAKIFEGIAIHDRGGDGQELGLAVVVDGELQEVNPIALRMEFANAIAHLPYAESRYFTQSDQQ